MPASPPTRRERDRLGEHLRHDVAAPRPERLAQADLPRPIADHHQHDVHDDDAAHEQRQRDDADQHRKDAGRRLLIDAQQRVGGEDAEVVRLARLETAAPPAGRRWRRPWPAAARRTKPASPSAESDWRAPNSFMWLPSGITANPSIDAPNMPPFRSLTPTTRKWTPWIMMVWSSGLTSPKSWSATSHPSSTTGWFRSTSIALIMRPALRVEGGEVEVFARDALDLDVFQHLVAVGDRAAAAAPGRPPRRCRAEPPDGVGLGERDERIVAGALLVLLSAHRRAAAGS